MLLLFRRAFVPEGGRVITFEVFIASNNLYKAINGRHKLTLWKANEKWEGISNFEHNDLIEQLGSMIDQLHRTKE